MHLPGMEPRFLGSLASKLSIIPTEHYWLICENGLKFSRKTLKGKYRVGYLDISENIILKCILKTWCESAAQDRVMWQTLVTEINLQAPGQARHFLG